MSEKEEKKRRFMVAILRSWLIFLTFLILSILLPVLLQVSEVRATSLEIKSYNERNEEEVIFAPGSKMLVVAETSDEVETAIFIVLKDKEPIFTERMKILSLSPKKFAYIYIIPENEVQGDYEAKVIVKGEKTVSQTLEFYVGQKLTGINSALVEIDNLSVSNLSVKELKEMFGEESRKKEEEKNNLSFLEKMVLFFKKILGVKRD